MIARYLAEGFSVQDNTRMPKDLVGLVTEEIKRVLSRNEEFSLDLSDGKPGNWFFLPDEYENKSGYIIFSYSIKEERRQNRECSSFVGIHHVEKGLKLTPYNCVAFFSNSKDKKQMQKYSNDARAFVKRLSKADSLKKIDSITQKERKRQMEESVILKESIPMKSMKSAEDFHNVLKEKIHRLLNSLDRTKIADEVLTTNNILKLRKEYPGYDIVSPFLFDGTPGKAFSDGKEILVISYSMFMHKNETLWNVITVFYRSVRLTGYPEMVSKFFQPFDKDCRKVMQMMKKLSGLASDPMAFYKFVDDTF